MEVKSSNPKAFDQLNVALKELDGWTAKIGWFASAVYPDGTPVAYVAAIQELGYGPIPPRSFFRTTVSEQKQKWITTAGALAKQVLEGKTTGAEAVEKMGILIESDVLRKIESITAPPLSPITLAARKYRKQGKKVTGKTIGEIARGLKDGTIDTSGVSTKPLDDTGYMISQLTSITEKV